MGETERAWELFGCSIPSTTARRPRQVAVYKVEPYVVAADVYAVAPHAGRGGWTWYTGSAGWMYRLLVETLLGVNLEGDRLRMAPRMPKAWTSFKVHYRYRQTVYHITVTRLAEDSAEPSLLRVDGQEVSGSTILLQDDHREHAAEMTVREAAALRSPSPARLRSPWAFPLSLSRLRVARRSPGLYLRFTVHADTKVLHHEQDAGEERQQPRDPHGDGQAEKEVEAEDDEEER